MMAIAVRTQARNVRSFAAWSLYRSIIAHRTPKVVDGVTTFHIMTEDQRQSHALKAGLVVIVPQGCLTEAPLRQRQPAHI
jgi:hypothetical protein